MVCSFIVLPNRLSRFIMLLGCPGMSNLPIGLDVLVKFSLIMVLFSLLDFSLWRNILRVVSWVLVLAMVVMICFLAVLWALVRTFLCICLWVFRMAVSTRLWMICFMLCLI